MTTANEFSQYRDPKSLSGVPGGFDSGYEERADAEADFRAELLANIPAMRAYARALTRNRTAADDLAQEAVLKAWAGRAQFRAGTSMKSWSFMIVRNLFLGERRRSWRTAELEPQVAENTLLADDNPSAILELDEVRQALEQLPELQREALILAGAGDASYEEIARICGCALGTVKSRVSRARTTLQLIMDQGDFPRDRQPAGNAAGAIMTMAEDIYRARA